MAHRCSIAVVFGTLFAGACAYQAPNSPTPTPVTPSTTPASIRVGASSRTDQTIDIIATVVTKDGAYVPGVTLTFAVDAGTITPASATTDQLGSAHASAKTSSATLLHVTGGGLSLQTALPASVSGTAPSAGNTILLNVPSSGTTGQAVSMFISSNGSGPISWNFGDGATASTPSFATTHTYGRSGTYNITAGDGVNTASGSIVISDPPAPTPTPTPVLSVAVECTPAAHGSATGCHVTMTDTSGTNITSSVTATDWDWGDGNPPGQPNRSVSTDPNGAAVQSHTYAVAGTYLVQARASSSAGSANGSTTVKIP
jgi:hypothetical protein